MCDHENKQAVLKRAENGYTNITLIEKVGDKWLVEINGSGNQTEVYEDEFIVEDYELR
ncbi:MAG: hypothetical protein LUF87_02095 [Alistipes sp.]|nr:hypothetical protein [Alistipes sp.]